MSAATSRRAAHLVELVSVTSVASLPSKLGVAALLLLIFQISSVVLVLRYVRTRPGEQQPSTACVVMMQELTKFIASLVWCCCDVYYVRRGQEACEKIRKSNSAVLNDVDLSERVGDALTIDCGAEEQQHRSFWVEYVAQLSYPSWWKLLLPAFLFSTQNVVLFTAMANLEPTTFLVLYQSKIFLTALLMIVVLHRKFGLQKWFAQALLVCGMVVSQLESNDGLESRKESKALGVAAVLVCATCSAVASVYMEKVLKDTDAFYLSTKNVYLSCFSMIIIGVPSFLRVYSGNDESFVSVLHGVDVVVVTGVILNQAIGGILVALTLRHADNIWKSFATTVAILVAGIASHALFGFSPTTPFLLGCLLVAIAVVLYSLHERC